MSGNGRDVSVAECMVELETFRHGLENVETSNRKFLNKLESWQRSAIVHEDNERKISEMTARGENILRQLEEKDMSLHRLTNNINTLCGKVDGLLRGFSAIKDTPEQHARQEQPSKTEDNTGSVKRTSGHPSTKRFELDNGQAVPPDQQHSSGRDKTETEQNVTCGGNTKQKHVKNTLGDTSDELPPLVNARGYKRRLTDDRTDNRLKSGHQPNIPSSSRKDAQSHPETVNIKYGERDSGSSFALARSRNLSTGSSVLNMISKQTSTMPGIDENYSGKLADMEKNNFVANLIFKKWYTYAETEKVIGSVSGLVRNDGPDTVLCLDTSASMQGAPFEKMMDLASYFVTGMEALKNVKKIEGNISVTTIGAETKVWIHMTDDFNAVQEILRQIRVQGPRGRSPLAGGLLVALAGCLGNGKHMSLGHLMISPQIVLISDGKGTPDHVKAGQDLMAESNNDLASKLIVDSNQKAVCENLKQRRNRVYCVPVGNADQDLVQTALETISKITSGKVYLPSAIDKLLGLSMRKISAALLLLGVSRSLGFLPNNFILRLLFERDQNQEHFTEEDKVEILEIMHDFVPELPDLVLAMEHDDDLPALGTRVRRGSGWKYEDQDSKGMGTVCSHGKDGKVWVEWDNGKVFSYDYKTEPKDVMAVNEYRVLKSDELIATGCRVTRGDRWRYADEDGGPGSVGVVIRVFLNGSVIIRWPNKSFSNLHYGFDGEFDVKIVTEDITTPLDNQACRSATHDGYVAFAKTSVGDLNRKNRPYQN
ncbi:uncharacterized protein LOC132562032 [Ylistrum balloti]|uniref:uncharacterized protein LOC132562032 n=1 Tax=Ylistrum balloti TaxID=509963 RepID=UPI002905ED98|nr:uncharacterized protein LOC132562032 [Ylistrum balloti]